MNGAELDAADPDRYLTADGALTADGDDAGRWLDTEHAHGTDWDTLADTLEVHPRVARHLHTLWCTARDQAADAAQHALFRSLPAGWLRLLTGAVAQERARGSVLRGQNHANAPMNGMAITNTHHHAFEPTRLCGARMIDTTAMPVETTHAKTMIVPVTSTASGTVGFRSPFTGVDDPAVHRRSRTVPTAPQL